MKVYDLTRIRRGGHSGFTVVEMMVVCLLTAVLATILATVWKGFCQPMRDASARCRLALEANLAAMSIAKDIGVSLPTASGTPITRDDGKFLGLKINSPFGFYLCYQVAGSSDPVPLIMYLMTDDNRLVRKDSTSGSLVETTVANEVVGLGYGPWSTGGGVNNAEITLTFRSRDMSTKDITLVYSLVAVVPIITSP